MHQNYPGFRICLPLTNGLCLERTLPKVPALSSSTPLYFSCMRNENILLVLQFYLPQGLAVQIALQSPSSTDKLARGQILQNFLGIQNTLPALVFLAFSHILLFLPQIFPSCFSPMLLLCFHKAVTFSCPYFLIFFISKK